LDAGTWTKPSAATKQRRMHHVPLSPQALSVLRDMRGNATGPFLFPGRAEGKPLGELKRAWASICKVADLEGVRIHDLRHSFASVVVSAGASLPIVGALLGHSSPAMTQRYAHLLEKPLRQAVTKAGAAIVGRGRT
jgi:integrase